MKTENLMIRINPLLKEQARRAAEREGKTMSEWVTDLIKLEIAKQKGSR